MFIDPQDLVVTEYIKHRESGDTIGVQILHRKTGAMVKCDTEDILHQNKTIAMNMLTQKLEEMQAAREAMMRMQAAQDRFIPKNNHQESADTLAWVAGDTFDYRNEEGNMVWQSGIHVPKHLQAIVCYGHSEVDAVLKRDAILKNINLVTQLQQALTLLLHEYIQGGESGDWGSWDPHEQDHVIQAKAILALCPPLKEEPSADELALQRAGEIFGFYPHKQDEKTKSQYLAFFRWAQEQQPK